MCVSVDGESVSVSDERSIDLESVCLCVMRESRVSRECVGLMCVIA